MPNRFEQPLQLLGGLGPAQFLSEYWQRKPLLVRAALGDWSAPIDGDELAGLACEPAAAARLVMCPAPGTTEPWRVEHGPFDEARFARLPASNVSLLVQDVDKWDPEVAALLDLFAFLPSWRVDDVMVSLGLPGGSVGPHSDRYDVFLLQAAGHRRWRIDRSPTPDLTAMPDQELLLLQQFEPTDDWLLGPGDMLYLPPGVPHHGVAEDRCLTYSIGMRTPAAADLLLDYSHMVAQQLSEDQRLSDAGRAPCRHPGEVDPATAERARQLLRDSLNRPLGEVQQWLAGFLSQTVPARLPDRQADDWTIARCQARAADGARLQRDPWVRFTFVRNDSEQAALFANGERFDTSAKTAELVCGQRELAGAELAAALADADSAALLVKLVARELWWFADVETD